jgi:membrane associated rhomboid family serine protease
MSTFFGLGDPTGGMYGDEMRIGGGGGRTDGGGEGVNVQRGIPPKILRNNSHGEQHFGNQKATVPDRDLVRGVEQGMAAYFKFVKKEKAYLKKVKPRRSIWEGTLNPSARDRTSSLRRGSLTGNATMMKISEKTMIREELMSLPEFKPVFIRLISLIQFLLMAAMVLFSLTELQFGKFGITNVGETCSSDTGNCPVKFNDDPDIGAVSVELFNPWMGPNTNFLIQFNAKYSPCMREDTAISQRLRQQRQDECGSRITYPNGDPAFNELCVAQFQGHSCCMYYPGQEDEANVLLTRGEEGLIYTNKSDALRQAGSRYGMMSLKNCQAVEGALWIQDNEITAGNNANMLCDIKEKDPVNIVLRPCCLGTRGTCQLLTKSQCNFRAGIFHDNHQICSDVACLAETCTTKLEESYLEAGTLEVKPHPEDNELVAHDQWQRFLAPIFLHSGAIHFFVMIAIQLYIGSPIERSIGFLRIMLIYMISGIGGYLISGIFDPYVVSVGSNPAVFGLLGVVLVELLQTWKVVPGAIYKLFKILAVIMVAVLVGSLPFVDNHAQMGGLVFGMLSACIFLPYISLGKWHERGRKIILFIAAPLLFILIITALVTFYAVQDTEWCTWCGGFNCWEWHSTLSCDGDVANV